MLASPYRSAECSGMAPLAAAALALVVSLVTGCAGSNPSAATAAPVGASPTAAPSPSATAWTSALCTGFAPIMRDQKRFTMEAPSLRAALVSDPAKVKGQVLADIDTLREDYQGVRDKLVTTGAPGVLNGAQVQSTVVDALAGVEPALSTAGRRLSAAPSTDVAAVATALRDAGTSVAQAGTDAQQAITQAGMQDTSKAIEDAGAANPECQAITSGG